MHPHCSGGFVGFGCVDIDVITNIGFSHIIDITHMGCPCHSSLFVCLVCMLYSKIFHLYGGGYSQKGQNLGERTTVYPLSANRDHHYTVPERKIT